MLIGETIVALGSIILLDIVLGGDNAVLIAMASKNLPEAQRRKAILWGTLGAILIRLLLTGAALYLLELPLLQFLGGIALLYIGWKLVAQEKHLACDTGKDLRGAIKIIISADVLMGLDNILAIAGASHGNLWLMCAGLAISIPVIMLGSQVILSWMDRFPWIIYAGAGVLAFTAGQMMVKDELFRGMVASSIPGGEVLLPAVSSVLLVSAGVFVNLRNARSAKSENCQH